MNHSRFARPFVRTTLIALCVTLPLAGCVVPASSPYASAPYSSGYAAQPAYAQPAQPVYAQPGYAQPPQYQQPYAQQPQYQQPGDDDQADWQNAPNQGYQPPQPQPQQGYGYGEQYGVVSSIQQLANPGAVTAGGVAGTVLGAVVGGVIGNQFGHGHGRDAATAVGVLGGAVAGNQLGQAAGASSPGGYRISVQLNDGTMRAFDVGTPGDLRPGDRVRIAGNQLNRY